MEGKTGYDDRISRAVALKCAVVYMAEVKRPLTYSKEDSDYVLTLADKFAAWLSTGVY